jgi:hypothetical protein
MSAIYEKVSNLCASRYAAFPGNMQSRIECILESQHLVLFNAGPCGALNVRPGISLLCQTPCQRLVHRQLKTTVPSSTGTEHDGTSFLHLMSRSCQRGLLEASQAMSLQYIARMQGIRLICYRFRLSSNCLSICIHVQACLLPWELTGITKGQQALLIRLCYNLELYYGHTKHYRNVEQFLQVKTCHDICISTWMCNGKMQVVEMT